MAGLIFPPLAEAVWGTAGEFFSSRHRHRARDINQHHPARLVLQTPPDSFVVPSKNHPKWVVLERTCCFFVPKGNFLYVAKAESLDDLRKGSDR